MSSDIYFNIMDRPFEGRDLRAVRLAEAIETALPGERMECDVVGDLRDSGDERVATSGWKHIRLADRDEYLLAAAARGSVTAYGMNKRRFISLDFSNRSKISSPGGEPCLFGMPRLVNPTAEWIHRCPELLAHMGIAAESTWGEASTESIVRMFGAQRRGEPAATGLPRLLHFGQLHNIWTPGQLGWANYWSPDTAHLLGLPSNDPIGARAQLLDNGAYLFLVTEEPMDLTRDDHVERLKATYERFKPIGGREQ